MNKTEYSRQILKRTTQSGSTPTINTATTIDSTWLATDILIGELFVNVEDDRMFTRTNNGIFELLLSPSGVTAGDYLPLSGGAMDAGAIISSANGGGQIQLDSFDPYAGDAFGGDADNVLITTDNGGYGESVVFLKPNLFEISSYTSGSKGYIYADDVRLNAYDMYIGDSQNSSSINQLQILDNSISDVSSGAQLGDGDRTGAVLINTKTCTINSGATYTSIISGSKNRINDNVTRSAIIGGTLNRINDSVNGSVIIAASGITASSDYTAYMRHSVNTGVAQFAEYTVATLPTASSYQGGYIMVTDETGGYVPAFSDGTNWRRTTDRAIIS